MTGATIITLGTNPILSVSGATSATDLDGNTINLDISVFNGGITLRYYGVLAPDNSDIDLARQVVFAELVRGLYKNIKNIYGAYEDINEDDIRRMYELFRKSFPKPEKEFKEVKKQRKELMDLGYDTFMVFVNTSLEIAQKRNEERDRVLPAGVVEKYLH